MKKSVNSEFLTQHLSDGEETNMAQNGPFAVVVFYCDENEGSEQYEWFQDATSPLGIHYFGS